jgi:hypothetical protein
MLHAIPHLKNKMPVFESLLHLGAGPVFFGALYGEIPAKEFLLVEADPEAAETLRAAAGALPGRVVECLVAARDGNHTFRRFSLPSLNGLLPLGPLQTIYPRVRETGSLPLQGRALPQLLESVAVSTTSPHALYFDLPGQEADLLETCAGLLPSRFEWIFVSGAGESRCDGARPLSDTLAILQRHHYEIVHLDPHTNPLVPVAILQCNRMALELEASRREADRLQAERSTLVSDKAALDTRLSTLVAERDALATEHEAMSTEFLQFQMELQKSQAIHSEKTAEIALLSKKLLEAEKSCEALKKELEASKASGAEVEKKRAEVAGQLEKLGADKAAMETRLSALVSERDARTKERDEHSKTSAERQATLEALRKDLEASKASGAEVEKKRAEVAGQLEKLGADKAAMETLLSALETERDARTKERDQVRTEKDNLTKERDVLKKTASDRASRIAELEAQVADQAERQKLIDEQMVRAETQLEMLKEFLQPAFQ